MKMFSFLIGKCTERLSYLYFIFRGTIQGEENLELLIDQPFLLAANHQSMLDFLALYSLFRIRYHRKIHFIAGVKLFRHPYWKHLMEYSETICTDQSKKDVLLLKKVKKVLDGGGIVGIFPEGTRSPDGNLVKAKDGAVKLTLLTKMPVLPVGLEGFYENWPRQKALPSFWPKRTRIVFGEPIPYEKFAALHQEQSNPEKMTGELMIAIGRLIGKVYRF